MPREATPLSPNPMASMCKLDGALSPMKESTWRSRAFAAAAELAIDCKARAWRRNSKGWLTYHLDVCPITGELYPDPDPFTQAPRIAASEDGIVIFTMPNRQGDQMHELLTKLRAAGHDLPMIADYDDPWGERRTEFQ